MHAPYLLTLGMAGALLAACQPDTPAAVEAPTPAQAVAPATPDASSQAGASTMERTCGAARVRLATGATPERISLSFVRVA